MKSLSRVVWSEGMHLAQHHFQAQNAYFEDVAGVALSSLFPASYGVLACEMDDAALLNGTAAVVAARGIMPDGLPFSFPEDTPPAALRIGDVFSPTQSTHVLLLAVPEHRPGRANCAANGDDVTSVRFSAVERSMPDETTGSDERPVQLARKNFRLILDTEPADGLVTLPIARVQRGGAGDFVYDHSHIGPTLRVAANRRLREMTARIVEMLEARARTVVAGRAGSAMEAEYAPREIAGFWLLHALNAALPGLRHTLRTGATHPEQLYLQLAQLAGSLCTFSLGSNPRDLPAYDHDAPESCFAGLDSHIRQHLDVVLPTAALTLILQPADVAGEGLSVPASGPSSFYAAKVPDTRCFDPTAQWFLGLRSSAPPGDIARRAAGLLKLCSAWAIGKLVERAYPGIDLEHVPVPPAAISPRTGMQYFLVRRTDPCWKSIVDTAEVGLYIPAALPDPEVELKVLVEQRG